MALFSLHAESTVPRPVEVGPNGTKTKRNCKDFFSPGPPSPRGHFAPFSLPPPLNRHSNRRYSPKPSPHFLRRSGMPTTEKIAEDPKHHRRVCFSFAAYAKAVIDHLKAAGIPIAAGLSDIEFTTIEDTYNFAFPPDLRSILREGLPIGASFPNWRSSSPQQLQILLALPVSGLLNEISKGNFWPESWGLKPKSTSDSVAMARSVLEKAPVLVPIYRHFYIASVPNHAGNPVLYIRGGEIRCVGFDLAVFFHREWKVKDRPAWAAKSARRVEVWTDLAEGGSDAGSDTWRERGWARGLKEMGWRLREGGWREDEVREMLIGETDGEDEGRGADRLVLRDRESVMWHVRLLALSLLRAGWSTQDVVYSMGGAQPEEKREVTWQVDPTPNEISIEL